MISRLSALLILLVGCSEGLDPPSLVNKLRVLAVRAQIPNPVPNTQTFADAIPGDMVTLDALVAGTDSDVDGGVTSDQIDYLWFACVPPPGSTSVRDCAGSAAPMAGFLPTCRGLSSDSVCLIGAAPTVTYPVPPDPLAMQGSIYISAVVATKPSGGALQCLQRLAQQQPPGDSCVVALKTLTVQPVLAARNSNPAVSTFNASGNDIHSTPMLKLGSPIQVTPLPLPSVSSEEKPDGKGEVMTYSWFATQKDFDHFHSGFVPPPLTPGENSDNTYTNQSTTPGRVHFWLVLRDDRGGVDWTDGFADFVMP